MRRLHHVGRPRGEGASAVADFALVSGLVAVLFMAVLQVGLALHIRNTLIACAAEGARLGARAGAGPAEGAARTRELVSHALSPRFARQVSAEVVEDDGIRVMSVRVVAPLPVMGPLGPDRALVVVGRAFVEDQ